MHSAMSGFTRSPRPGSLSSCSVWALTLVSLRTRELERALVLGDGEGAALAKAHQTAMMSLANYEVNCLAWWRPKSKPLTVSLLLADCKRSSEAAGNLGLPSAAGNGSPLPKCLCPAPLPLPPPTRRPHLGWLQHQLLLKRVARHDQLDVAEFGVLFPYAGPVVDGATTSQVRTVQTESGSRTNSLRFPGTPKY